MQTITDQWKHYRDTVYPKGVPAEQNIELHQAFFAGALVMFGAMNEVSALPENQAVHELDKIGSEVMAVNQSRHDQLKARN